MSSGCRNRSICKECGRRHHTLSHGVKPKSTEICPEICQQPDRKSQETQHPFNKNEPLSEKPPVAGSASSNLISVMHSSATESASIITNCQIIQVLLFHKDNPAKAIKVYALLDDASDTTFVTTQVQRELGIKGVETSLDLSTMLGRQRIAVERIDGLIVQQLDKRTEAAEYESESLNKHLLQGPNLTNNLTGVLCRFRQEPMAFMCDIETMFHQVKVSEEFRDLLRFLWWEDGDLTKEPKEYRMTVHLFGATSSPGCANFALKSTANDFEEEFGASAADFVRKDFYVDDGLKSVPLVDDAVKLIVSVKQMCSKGGFRLHKFVSNSKEVIRRIPEQDRADDVKELDLDLDSLPLERTLGIHWCVESDCFQLATVLQDKPCTRRGILSTVSSIFDPLGFIVPLL